MQENTLYTRYLKTLGNMPEFMKPYLNVPSLTRLKEIGYFCGMDYASKNIYSFKEKLTRYDHSISVAMLTWKFTNDKKATLAALFHDVATPCFAHVIDYMNGDYINQESTEEYTEKILRNDSELASLLEKDRIKVDEIINFKNYTIVDNHRPKMCADRFDGIILTGLAWTKDISYDDIISMVNDLKVFEDEEGKHELGFKSLSVAQKALDTSENIDRYCHSNSDNYMMQLLADITKMSIKDSIITYDDLYSISEKELFERMKKSNDKQLLNNIEKFENVSINEIPETVIDGIKIRALNPLVNGKRIK